MISRSFPMVFYQNLLIQLKQIKRNAMLILLPIVIFLFIYLFFDFNKVATEFVSQIQVGVLDKDNTVYSSMLLESFDSNDFFSQFINIINDDEKTLKEDFKKGKIDVLITAPKGFAINLFEADKAPLQIEIGYSDPVKAILFMNVVEAFEDYVKGVQRSTYAFRDEMLEVGIEPEIVSSDKGRLFLNLLLTALGRNVFFEGHRLVNVPAVEAVKYYFVAILVMFLMYLSIFAAINLMREKQNMCLRRLRITRISLFEYLMAKVLATTAYMVIIVGIWYGIFYVFYGALAEGELLSILLFLVVSIFFDVALALSFTIFFDQEEPVILLSSVFIFMNAVLGGSIIPIHNMSYVMQRIAKFTPNYWMIKGFLYLDVGYKTYEILILAFILFGLSMIMILLTSLKYQRRET